MLFNSLHFIVFFPIVFFIYWIVGKKSALIQNSLLLIASFYFYSCWDYRFLALLGFSILLDYIIGIELSIQTNQRKRQTIFWIGIVINISILVFFKYYNFFVDNFVSLFQGINIHLNITTLKIILPIGISFYTFHGLSYIIDIYYQKIKPEKRIINYALFVSYFPLLIAGPIERATHLLPQLKEKRAFNYREAIDGLRQILWGFFKKIVIADSCANIVNTTFDTYSTQSGSALLISAILFAFQIYGDFSGYSDIAIGTSRLLGINLLKNFSYPYFSRDIAEFWRRWHISLTTWFRDYIYIPLGGSRVSKIKIIRNTFIIFIISGFWHGANWTFIIWGAFHALLFLPLILFHKNRKHLNDVTEGHSFPSFKEFFQMLFTFSLVVIGWIFFRADSISIAFGYLSRMIQWGTFRAFYRIFALPEIWSIFALVIVEWIGRHNNYALEAFGFNWKRWLRLLFYYALLTSILLNSGSEQPFIYFQF